MKPVWLIGAGNVAWHLAHAFRKSGVRLGGIWSRAEEPAIALAAETGTTHLKQIEDFAGQEGVLLLAVPDQAIPSVVSMLPWAGLDRMMVLHTSGATTMEVFPPGRLNVGVFYPLQTLSKGRPTDFLAVPILLSLRDQGMLSWIQPYAADISRRVLLIEDRERAWYHLSAVFVNNFVQHLGNLALSTLQDKDLDRTVLLPLLHETVRKLEENQPGKLQTGPAIRGDLRTIHAHLRMLAEYPGLARIYRQISHSINPDLPL